LFAEIHAMINSSLGHYFFSAKIFHRTDSLHQTIITSNDANHVAKGKNTKKTGKELF